MGTLGLRVDLGTQVIAEGTRDAPVIEIADGEGRWAIRLLGTYEALQRVCGDGLYHLYKLPDGTAARPPEAGKPGIEEPYLRDDLTSS